MPELTPFHGVRYSPKEKTASVTCPPYDIISPSQQRDLYALDPHNAVRLELPAGDGLERYEAAAQTFDEWLADGTLVRDAEPSLYVYRQDFVYEGSAHHVTGVVGALRLEPFGSDSGVLPHERTMEGPKADRLALMRALPVNVSPIYSIYRGHGAISEFLDSLTHRPTAARFEDHDDILHRMWVITAPAEVELLADAVGSTALVIADGHHRYETALAYATESGHPDATSIMSLCVDADSAQLIVLPYHRLLKAPHIEESLRNARAAPIDGDPDAMLRASSADHAFAFVTRDGAYAIEVSDEDVVAVVGARHPAWRSLDVVALHEVVLPRVFEDVEVVAFTKDRTTVEQSVAAGSADCGVLLRPLHASDVVDVARSGERMPQKASYFWPKAVTGLVFHPLA